MNKILSIRQPWIDLILQGKKTLEIRSWKSPVRGEVYLHSAYNMDRDALKIYPMEDPERSAIIGTVRIDDIEELSERRWRELAEKHLSRWPWDPVRCRYGFWLSRPQRLEHSVPCIGKSFFFEREDLKIEYRQTT